MNHMSYFEFAFTLMLLAAGLADSADAGRESKREDSSLHNMKNQSINVHRPEVVSDSLADLSACSEADGTSCDRVTDEAKGRGLDTAGFEEANNGDKAAGAKDKAAGVGDEASDKFNISEFMKGFKEKQASDKCGLNLREDLLKVKSGNGDWDQNIRTIQWGAILKRITAHVKGRKNEEESLAVKLEQVSLKITRHEAWPELSYNETAAIIEEVYGASKKCLPERDETPNAAFQSAFDSFIRKFEEVANSSRIVKASTFDQAFMNIHTEMVKRNVCHEILVQVTEWLNSNGADDEEILELEFQQARLSVEIIKIKAVIEECSSFNLELVTFKEHVDKLNLARHHIWEKTEDTKIHKVKLQGELESVATRINKSTTTVNELEKTLTHLQIAKREWEADLKIVLDEFAALAIILEEHGKKVNAVQEEFTNTSNAAEAAIKVRIHLEEFLQLMNLAWDQAMKPLADTQCKADVNLNFADIDLTLAREELDKLKNYCAGNGSKALRAVGGEVEVDGKWPCAICDNEWIRNTNMTMTDVTTVLKQRQQSARDLMHRLSILLDPGRLGVDWNRTDELKGGRRFAWLYPNSKFYSQYLRGWMVVKDKGKKKDPYDNRSHPQTLLKLWIALTQKKEVLDIAKQEMEESQKALKVKVALVVTKQTEVELKIQVSIESQAINKEAKNKCSESLKEFATQQSALNKDLAVLQEDIKRYDDQLETAENAIKKVYDEMTSSLLEAGYEKEHLQQAYHSALLEMGLSPPGQ